MRKGDIVLVAFPFTDLSGAKVRPALVLWSSPKGEDFIAAFISSAARKHRVAISVPPSPLNGLKKVSHVRIDKLAALQKKSALGRLGVLEPRAQKQVDSVLRGLLGL
jgi:mRNA interferase MazF